MICEIIILPIKSDTNNRKFKPWSSRNLRIRESQVHSSELYISLYRKKKKSTKKTLKFSKFGIPFFSNYSSRLICHSTFETKWKCHALPITSNLFHVNDDLQYTSKLFQHPLAKGKNIFNLFLTSAKMPESKVTKMYIIH